MNCVIEAWGAHEGELRGFLIRQLGDPVLAEDLLQETFLRAVAGGAKFCSLENPRAWLFRVARSRLADHFRRDRSAVALDDLPEDLPGDAAEVAAVASLDACLPLALQELAPADREIIERCDLEGMTQARYAEEAGLSLSGAKSRLQRARRRLKTALVAHCRITFDEAGQVCCFAGDRRRSALPAAQNFSGKASGTG